MEVSKKNGLIFFLALLIPFFALPVFASSTNGTIDSIYKYAWSNNVGWINFSPTNGNVVVIDSAITGYAWSENYGWINLSPTNSGINNDGYGDLSGYAWGENLGWINFANVEISSVGKFSGTATGDIIGTLTFDCTNCDVRTDWQPINVRAACNNTLDDDGDSKIDYPNDPGCSSLDDNDETDPASGSGMPVEWYNPPVPPEKGFEVLINNNAEHTNSFVVSLNLRGGLNTKKMAISNFSDFSNVGQELYVTSKEWNLCENRKVCPEGKYIVYVKFYAPWGKSSEVVSDSIIYKKAISESFSKLQPPSFAFTKNLYIGFKDFEVKLLQQFLNKNGFLLAGNRLGSSGNETEYFGKLTQAALIKFQEAYASEILAPLELKRGTGFFGPSTRKFINSVLSSGNLSAFEQIEVVPSSIFINNLFRGMKNQDVKRLQRLLASDPEIYPEGLVTSYFGPLTEKAVQRFQIKYGVVSSSDDPGFGCVGPKTRAKLKEVFEQ